MVVSKPQGPYPKQSIVCESGDWAPVQIYSAGSESQPYPLVGFSCLVGIARHYSLCIILSYGRDGSPSGPRPSKSQRQLFPNPGSFQSLRSTTVLEQAA